jgi:hypothetical protein
VRAQQSRRCTKAVCAAVRAVAAAGSIAPSVPGQARPGAHRRDGPGGMQGADGDPRCLPLYCHLLMRLTRRPFAGWMCWRSFRSATRSKPWDEARSSANRRGMVAHRNGTATPSRRAVGGTGRSVRLALLSAAVPTVGTRLWGLRDRPNPAAPGPRLGRVHAPGRHALRSDRMECRDPGPCRPSRQRTRRRQAAALVSAGSSGPSVLPVKGQRPSGY